MGKIADALTGRRMLEEGADPDYRFSLANERTFLAWIRTSLALLAGGVAVLQLAPVLGPRWVRIVLAVALVVFAIVLASMSHQRWRRNERAMRSGRSLPMTGQIPLLAYGVAVTAVAALVAVLVFGGTGP